MRVIPSQVFGASNQDSNIGYLIPTYIPQPESYVFEYVRDVCGVAVSDPARSGDVVEVGTSFPISELTPNPLPVAFNRLPTAMLYEHPNGQGDMRGIPVVRGWPPYPGRVPMIGVALGNDADDDQLDVTSGGFAGDVVIGDGFGNIVATGSYYAEALYSTIVVELIHENREERDRLHDELRRVLFPLRDRLLDRTPLIRRVRLDAEKDELPMDEAPFVVYVSLFTVHVYYEMLVAQDVTGPDGTISTVNVAAVPTPEPVNQTSASPVVLGGIVFPFTEGAEAALGVTFPFDGSGLPFMPEIVWDFPVPPDTA
jgi:hypothetical protein